MKKIIFSFLASLLFAAPAMAGNFDKVEIDKEVNAASFKVGCDRKIGCLWYIIDQTNGICFAALTEEKGGLAQVDCNKLMKIEKIRNFYDTGKLDK